MGSWRHTGHRPEDIATTVQRVRPDEPAAADRHRRWHLQRHANEERAVVICNLKRQRAAPDGTWKGDVFLFLSNDKSRPASRSLPRRKESMYFRVTCTVAAPQQQKGVESSTPCQPRIRQSGTSRCNQSSRPSRRKTTKFISERLYICSCFK